MKEISSAIAYLIINSGGLARAVWSYGLEGELERPIAFVHEQHSPLYDVPF